METDDLNYDAIISRLKQTRSRQLEALKQTDRQIAALEKLRLQQMQPELPIKGK